jgi:multiple sugar transport system substrate-binding protein
MSHGQTSHQGLALKKNTTETLMKKRLLASVMGALLATSMTAQATSIDYWYWKDNPDDKTIEQLAGSFEKETGIHVNLMSDVTYNDFFNYLINSVAAGTSPCASALNGNYLGRLTQAHVLEPLNSRIAAWPGKNAVTPSLWVYETGVDGKTQYALPNKFLVYYMYYRKDILQAAGVAVPKTQQEFVEAAKAVAASAPGKRYAFNLRAGGNGADQWAAFLVSGGAKFADNSGKIILDSPEAQTSNRLYQSTYKWAPPGTINMASGGQMIQELEAGTTAMVIHHLGTSKQIKLGPDKLGVAPIPSLTGDPAKTTYFGIMNMNGVLSTCKNKDEAFKWIAYLAEPKAQLAIAKAPDGYLPVLDSVAHDPAFANNPFFQVSLQEASHALLAWPPVPGTTTVGSAFPPAFQSALLGNAPPESVIKAVSNALSAKR